MVKLTNVPTKVMGYWLVAGNGCGARCPSTDVSNGVDQICGPHYWKYGKRSMVTVPVGICSNTPLYDTKRSVSREKGWRVINEEIVWSDSGVMSCYMVFSETVCKIFLTWVSMNSEMLLQNLI